MKTGWSQWQMVKRDTRLGRSHTAGVRRLHVVSGGSNWVSTPSLHTNSSCGAAFFNCSRNHLFNTRCLCNETWSTFTTNIYSYYKELCLYYVNNILYIFYFIRQQSKTLWGLGVYSNRPENCDRWKTESLHAATFPPVVDWSVSTPQWADPQSEPRPEGLRVVPQHNNRSSSVTWTWVINSVIEVWANVYAN